MARIIKNFGMKFHKNDINTVISAPRRRPIILKFQKLLFAVYVPVKTSEI